MSSQLTLGLDQLESGLNIRFSLSEHALVLVYIEVPDEVDVVLAITSTKNLFKQVALSTDQDVH